MIILLTSYEYFVRESKIKHLEENIMTERTVVNIGIRNKINGTIAPSPLTDFIIKYYESTATKLNSSRAPANIIVRFLNYLNRNIAAGDPDFKDLQIQGISGLNLQHGSRFLTYQAVNKGNKNKTIEQYENYLSDFYIFLHSQNLTNLYKVNVRKVFYKYGEGIKKYVDFNDAPQPPIRPNKNQNENSYRKLKDFGENRIIMVREFIDVASNLYPEIALGIAFMFFGGVRRGEVINLSLDSIRYKRNSYCILEIRNRADSLFRHIKNNSKNQVKVERDQIILISPYLDELYRTHMELLPKRKGYNTKALFINRDGKPITGKSFEDKFKKIKEVYLSELSKKLDRREDYEFITGVRWSNHIGRGVFTNFLLSIGTPLTEVSIARGDKSPDSLLAYIEELNSQAALKKGSEIIGKLYKDYKENLTNENVIEALEKGAKSIEPEYVARFKDIYTKLI